MNKHIVEHLSFALYVGLCHEVGTPTMVQIRRDAEDIKDAVLKQCGTINQRVLSGSRREGLRMADSDVDVMLWPTDWKVTFDAFNSNSNNFIRLHKKIELLAVPVCEQPGFVLLRFITNTFPKNFVGALIQIHNDIYISSCLFREEVYIQNVNWDVPTFLHGPCTGIKDYYMDIDFACCLSCDEWPFFAIPWIERCYRKGWPSSQIMNDVVSNGCHFVPIGARNSPLEQHEWRISFSIAEKILVTSMTHTQFLCYATLKFFLKEVIDIRTTKRLICSYFLKTVLFWELQENRFSALMPCQLLMCFWKCFKHLIKWVYKGECPNFFIPSNNMFRGKIVGAAQTQLLTDLYKLYDFGISSLLICPSVSSYLVKAMQNPTLMVNTNERNIDFLLDFELFLNLKNVPIIPQDNLNLNMFLSILDIIGQSSRLSMTQYKTIIYQGLASHALQHAAYLLIKHAYIPNRQIYVRHKISCSMMKLAAKIGDISDLLHFAIYYYKTLRYDKAINCVEKTRERLSHPYVIHEGKLFKENLRMYEETVGSLSVSKKVKNAWSPLIRLTCNYNCINILKLECNQNEAHRISIPSYVMVSLLSFLCQHGNPQKQDEALYDLQYLLLYDDGCYVTEKCKDISWQILGICYQLRGNLYEALYSYQQSLKCKPGHFIQKCSHVRISSVITELSLRNL